MAVSKKLTESVVKALRGRGWLNISSLACATGYSHYTLLKALPELMRDPSLGLQRRTMRYGSLRELQFMIPGVNYAELLATRKWDRNFLGNCAEAMAA